MTRKKFVKILMANGCSRNEANKFALKCRELKKPYEDYIETNYVWTRLSVATEKIRSSFDNLSKFVGEFATTAFSRLSKSLSSVEVENFYKYLTTEL